MAEDIIDVIHRLTYQVDESPLKNVSNTISQQVEKVKTLQKENKALASDLAKTAASEVQKRDEITKKINENKAAIKSLNDEVTNNIVTSKELQAALVKEQGIIGGLNTQLDILKKKRDAATDPAAIQKYNQQISAITAQQKATLTQQGVGGGNPSGAIMGLNNIVRDAPFGIIGIGNNITQLTDNYAQLVKQTGSAGAANKVFLQGLMGVGGLSLGISAVTSLLTVLTMKYGSLDNAIKVLFGTMTEADKIQQGYTDSLAGANKEYEKAYTNVAELRKNIDLAKAGFLDKDRVVKEYNDTIGKTTGAVKNLDEAERALNKNAEAYIQFTLLKAAANVALQKAAEKAFEAEMTKRKSDEESLTFFDKLAAAANNAGAASGPGGVVTNANQQRGETERAAIAAAERRRGIALRQAKNDEDVFKKIADDLRNQAEQIAKDSNFSFLPPTTDKKAPENVFAQRLQALKSRLASITEATFQSDDTIRAKISEAIERDQVELDKLLKEKKLTSPQRDILTGLLGTIKEAELSKAFADFNKARMEAQRKIDDELDALILQDSKQRTALIRDEYERQNALLTIDFEQSIAALQKAKEAFLKDNADKANRNLINQDEALKNIDFIEKTYAKLFTNLKLLFDQKKADLSLTLFDQALSFDKTGFAQQGADQAEKVERDVKALTNKYVKGQLSYRKYQKQLTQILREETTARRTLSLTELEDELELQERKRSSAILIGSSDKDINTIEKRIADLRAQIAALKKEVDQSDADNKKKDVDRDKAERDRKIAGVRAVVDATAEGARMITQIEQDRVNSEIELQNQRVNRVQAIADRGNAKALQQEQQRLNTLTKEREKFARQQLAINAIQTVSSSILAIASAAGETGAGAIVIVPAVIAALAAGFAAVKGLTSDTQNFRDGVVGLNGPGTATSDSIPANLSRGESVVTAAGTTGHRDILEAMNSGRRFQMVDHNKVLELSAYGKMPTMVSIPLQPVMPAAATGNNQDYKMLLKEVRAMKEVIESKPTQSWHLDRRGFVLMHQDVIEFEDKMKRL